MDLTASIVVGDALSDIKAASAAGCRPILVLTGRLNAVFRSSMEVEVEVRSEDPLTGERHLTTRAFVTMVAMNSGGRTSSAPHLLFTSDEERQRAAAAGARRLERIARRA